MKHNPYAKRMGILVLVALGVPGYAFASVQISEIMYDVSGSDSGREWIEITNTESQSVDVSDYRLFEANTNHALTLVSGSATLPAGASAIIADDPVKFKIDWPNFSGTLFDSSFDLSNTGETLALKDENLSTVDSVTYNSSMGAGGDGMALQRSGTVFSPGTPTPGGGGSPSNQNTSTTNPEPSPAVTQVVVTQTASASAVPPITADIRTDEKSMVGGGTYFQGVAYGLKGLPLSNARFIWNFGDGTTAEGETVLHVYAYPGAYDVALSVASDISETMVRTVVTAVAPHVALFAEDDGSLTVANLSDSVVDIGAWRIACGEHTFLIPKNTAILAQGGIRFASLVTGCISEESARAAQLLFANGALAASAEIAQGSKLRGEAVSLNSVRTKISATPQRTSSPKGNVPPAVSEKPATTSLGASVAFGGFSTPLVASVLGLFALIGIALGGLWYMQFSAESARPDNEFDIE